MRYVRVFDEADVVVGGCELQARTITVGGGAHAIAALGGVEVEERLRRGGAGTRMVRAWMDTGAGEGYDVGVLFTGPHRRAFYERLGWQLLEGGITWTSFGEEQPAREGTLVMAAALDPSAANLVREWRTAPIHVGVGTW